MQINLVGAAAKLRDEKHAFIFDMSITVLLVVILMFADSLTIHSVSEAVFYPYFARTAVLDFISGKWLSGIIAAIMSVIMAASLGIYILG